MEYTKLIYENKDNIAYITLNDPENMNAVGPVMFDELDHCLSEVNTAETVRAVVIKGAGKLFSAGGNIKRFKEQRDKCIPEGKAFLGPTVKKLGDIVMAIRKLKKPVIASIRGAAAGAGLNIALACDIKIATPDVKMSEGFVKLGLIPDGGGIVSLARAIGANRTMELLLTGRTFTGQEAYEWGLINEIVPEEELDKRTNEFALMLSKGPTATYARIKDLVYQAVYSDLSMAIDREIESQDWATFTEDFAEAVNAFLEKRPADFKGK